MLLIPLHWPNGKFDLVVVLEEENLDRMKEADPAEIRWEQLGAFAAYKPSVVRICYGDAATCQGICKLMERGKVMEAVELVSHNWKFRPEAGDHDFGPISLLKKGN